MYYYVVFNGFHLTEQKITSYSKNDKASDLVKFLEFLSVVTVNQSSSYIANYYLTLKFRSA